MESYGLWFLVVFNSAFFILFTLGFFRPASRRDWRSFGAFSAFLVALFSEMYGFPLTIYLLSGWLQTRYPGIDWLAHDSGHLPEMLFGWREHPHLGPFHMMSMILIAAGFVLLVRAWPVLYRAQRTGTLATRGPYARVRHPQYLAFALIMVGFLVQWPTLLTVLMFPVLMLMYRRLALREEEEAKARFGEAYLAYAERVPRFIPRRRRPTAPPATGKDDESPCRDPSAVAHLIVPHVVQRPIDGPPGGGEGLGQRGPDSTFGPALL